MKKDDVIDIARKELIRLIRDSESLPKDEAYKLVELLAERHIPKVIWMVDGVQLEAMNQKDLIFAFYNSVCDDVELCYASPYCKALYHEIHKRMKK